MGMAIVGGLHVMLMIYAIGGISSAHMNLVVNFVFVSQGVLPFVMVCITHTTYLEHNFCHNPSLGLTTKVRACEGAC
jgi:hypothetical protein